MIGTAHVAQSEPDGYTLLFNTTAVATAPAIYDDLPFDPQTDLTPVSMVSYSPFLMVAGSSVEATTFGALLEEAAGRSMFVATAGLGSSSHFAAELFVGVSGRDIDVVHYSGGGPALTDLMGGHADIYISSTAASMAAVSGGQVKPIGILGAARFASLPDTESAAEVGLEVPDIRIWQGIFGPGGMPETLIEKIEEDVATVLANDAFLQMLNDNYMMASDVSSSAFRTMVIEEMAFWSELAETRQIRAE